MLPTTLKPIFWDAPFESIDRESNKGYVISRILELGDEPAVSWLRQQYTDADLQSVVKSSRSLSEKSKNYWRLKFNVI
jgi:hypothetical protein